MSNLFRDNLYNEFPDPNKKIEELGELIPDIQGDLGDLTELSWLPKSVVKGLKDLTSWVEQRYTNVKQPPFNAYGDANYYNSADGKWYINRTSSKDGSGNTVYTYSDLAHDDTAAIQAALNFMNKSGKPLFFPKGKYMVGALTTNFTAGGIVGEGRSQSMLVPNGNVGTLLKYTNSAYIMIRDFGIDGKGQVDVCLDTTFDPVNGAPSVNNFYQNVMLQGYKVTAWLADHNNDCSFDHVLITGSDVQNSYAMQLQANGGAITLDRCVIYNPIKINCQNAMMNSCVIAGIDIIGADTNHLQMNGSYWYANKWNSCNLYIGSGFQAYCPALNGMRIENEYTDGFIIGGSGVLYNGASFNAPHIFTMHGATNVKLIASTITSPMKSRITLMGGVIESNIVVSDTTYFIISKLNTSIGGFNSTYFDLAMSNDGQRSFYAANDKIGFKGAFGEVSSVNGQVTSVITNAQTATIAAITPKVGFIIVNATDGNGPTGIFYFVTGLGNQNNVVTKLGGRSGSGGGDVTVTIPNGTNRDVNITHTYGTATAFKYTIIGS